MKQWTQSPQKSIIDNRLSLTEFSTYPNEFHAPMVYIHLRILHRIQVGTQDIHQHSPTDDGRLPVEINNRGVLHITISILCESNRCIIKYHLYQASCVNGAQLGLANYISARQVLAGDEWICNYSETCL